MRLFAMVDKDSAAAACSIALNPPGCRGQNEICFGSQAPALICSSPATKSLRHEVAALETGSIFYHLHFYDLQGTFRTVVENNLLFADAFSHRLIGVGLITHNSLHYANGPELAQAPRVLLASAIERAQAESLPHNRRERELALLQRLNLWTRWPYIRRRWLKTVNEIKTRWIIDNFDSAARITYLVGNPDCSDLLEGEWQAGNERLVLRLPVPVARQLGVAVNGLQFDVRERIKYVSPVNSFTVSSFTFEDEITFNLPFLIGELASLTGNSALGPERGQFSVSIGGRGCQEKGRADSREMLVSLNGFEHGRFYAEFSCSTGRYLLKRPAGDESPFFWTQALVTLERGRIVNIVTGSRDE